MSGKFADERIATTLNRLGLRTGAGNTWTVERIYTLRYRHGLLNNNLSHANVNTVTLEEAAHRLGISASSVRRMIVQKLLPATQVVQCAPWEIPVTALENEAVRTAVGNIKNRVRLPRTQTDQSQVSLFSTTW